MAFNLPDAQYLMRSNSSSNRGSFDSAFQTGQKTGGNLPITFVAAQVQNGGGNEGIYFGMDSQNTCEPSRCCSHFYSNARGLSVCLQHQ